MKFMLVAVPDHVELPAVEGLLIAAHVYVEDPSPKNVSIALQELTNNVRGYLKHGYEPPPKQQLDRELLQRGIKPTGTEKLDSLPPAPGEFATEIGEPPVATSVGRDRIWRCKRLKVPGDGGIADGCGWQGPGPVGACPSCGSVLLREVLP